MEYQMLGYFAKFPFCYLPAPLCQIAKSTLPSPCFAIFFTSSFFLFANSNYTKLHESTLPKLAFLICQTAKLALLNSQSNITMSEFSTLFCYFARFPSAIFLFCQIAKSSSACGLPKISFKLSTN